MPVAEPLPADAASALRALRQDFRAAGLPTPDLDARLLLEHLAGMSPLDLIRAPNARLAADAALRLTNARARRLRGEPVHRILGFRAFHGLHLTLSPDTLEPRPDTEILVEAVLPFVRERCRSHGGCRILDLGTGTGAIALALLVAEPKATALGTDISRGALDAAQRNAHINGVADRFTACQSDWFASLDGRFDLIVSNPPYIASSEITTLDPHVAAHDPLRALDGGPDGLDAYRILARDARRFLQDDGQVAVEIGWDQRDSVAALFAGHGFVLIGALCDLGGNNRVLMFR